MYSDDDVNIWSKVETFLVEVAVNSFIEEEGRGVASRRSKGTGRERGMENRWYI